VEVGRLKRSGQSDAPISRIAAHRGGVGWRLPRPAPPVPRY
jgi:hypothetical protein